LIIKKVNTKKELKQFYAISSLIYEDIKYFRATDKELIKFLVEGISSFHSHSEVIPYLIIQDKKVVGRFVLIFDIRLKEYVQISFLEFLPETDKILVDKVIETVNNYTSKKKKIIFGLNGHLNYGVGYLKNKFNEIPVYGLPYTPEYYLEYFKNLKERELVSFRLPLTDIEKFSYNISEKFKNNEITVRCADFNYFDYEIEIYTSLNNNGLRNHPFWSERDAKEDIELFEPLKFMIKPEHLLIAEYKDTPVGFLLWFPDFNQLLKRNDSELKYNNKLSPQFLQYKFFNKIDTFRLSEIVIIPEFHKKFVDIALIKKLTEVVKPYNYKFCEGGFIFKENFSSINLATRYIHRFLNKKLEAFRKFGVYEYE
jgi:hypothetical protein